jgi:competence protein ComEC
LLVISHPDKDHFDDLDSLISNLGDPKVLIRNKTVPDLEKYGSCDAGYQRAFKRLDTTYTSPVVWEESPLNPAVNGGVEIKYGMLNLDEASNINNSSVVILYYYMQTMLVFPGDIEDGGWVKLLAKSRNEFLPLVGKAYFRILVAPHHGRGSGYSQSMIDFFNPNLVVISDEYGREPTDRRFREAPGGITIKGESRKYISTKTNGRALFTISDQRSDQRGLTEVDWS